MRNNFNCSFTKMRQICNGVKKLITLENLIYLTIFGLPLYLIRLSFFGISLNVLDVLEVTVFLWWILNKDYIKPPAREIFFRYKNYLIATSLIFFGLVASIFVNGEYKTGLGIVKSWFALPVLFIFAVANIFDYNKVRNVFRAFYGSAFVVAFISLAYFFLGILTFDGRLEGLFNSPNYLAMYLAPAVIMGAVFFGENKRQYVISLMVIILALYLTFSYASWTALALALTIVELVKKKFSWKIFVGTVLILGIFLAIQSGTSKWNNFAGRQERSSFSSRLMIWSSAQKIAEDNPMWGIGPGNFQKKYLEYQKFSPPYLEWAVPHPHNLYLAFWLQSGLFGLAGVAVLLYFWVKSILRAESSALKIITIGTMAYILLHGLVDTTYFKNDLAVIFWLNFLIINKLPHRYVSVGTKISAKG